MISAVDAIAMGALALLVGCTQSARGLLTDLDGGPSTNRDAWALGSRTDARAVVAPRDGSLADADTGTMAGDVSFGTSPACTDPRSLYSGSTLLIAAYAAPKGILIVQQDRIRLVDRAGNELNSALAERPFSTAAFDGEWLAVADNAIVSAYSVDLEPKGSIKLVEACGSSVIVSGQRFVCGSASDSDRVFYVYDLVQQALLAQSSNYYTYNGIPMRRVAGRDFFITVNDDMTADYHLYQVDALSNLAFYGGTSYFGAFKVTREYAFTGKPADHLVTPQGIMLNIFTATCTSIGMGSGCMVKDGNLGTLWPQEVFVTLTNDEAGDIYSLVGLQKATSTANLCAGDCRVQHIDPVQRVVVSQRGFGPTVKSIVTTQHDPYCDMLLVGYVGATSDYNLDLVAY